MINPKFVSFYDLELLFNPKFIEESNITVINLLREITGQDSKKSKAFFEKIIQPAILKLPPVIRQEGEPEDLDEIRQAIAELKQEVSKLNQQQAKTLAKGILS